MLVRADDVDMKFRSKLEIVFLWNSRQSLMFYYFYLFRGRQSQHILKFRGVVKCNVRDNNTTLRQTRQLFFPKPLFVQCCLPMYHHDSRPAFFFAWNTPRAIEHSVLTYVAGNDQSILLLVSEIHIPIASGETE